MHFLHLRILLIWVCALFLLNLVVHLLLDYSSSKFDTFNLSDFPLYLWKYGLIAQLQSWSHFLVVLSSALLVHFQWEIRHPFFNSDVVDVVISVVVVEVVQPQLSLWTIFKVFSVWCNHSVIDSLMLLWYHTNYFRRLLRIGPCPEVCDLIWRQVRKEAIWCRNLAYIFKKKSNYKDINLKTTSTVEDSSKK